MQAHILTMLCQLLDLKVNYTSLDSKRIFLDFVLKQLEVIESGGNRDAEKIVPSIIEFLISLTKQKDKKLITIPKIIHIIDNLLATTNDQLRNCGVKSLNVLSLELFFKNQKLHYDVKHPPTPESLELFNKEINTQKEVVLSMLMKFSSVETVNIINLILVL